MFVPRASVCVDVFDSLTYDQMDVLGRSDQSCSVVGLSNQSKNNETVSAVVLQTDA